MNDKGLGRDVSLLARQSRLVPNPSRPNFSMRVTTTQTSREKRTASSLRTPLMGYVQTAMEWRVRKGVTVGTVSNIFMLSHIKWVEP